MGKIIASIILVLYACNTYGQYLTKVKSPNKDIILEFKVNQEGQPVYAVFEKQGTNNYFIKTRLQGRRSRFFSKPQYSKYNCKCISGKMEAGMGSVFRD